MDKLAILNLLERLDERSQKEYPNENGLPLYDDDEETPESDMIEIVKNWLLENNLKND